MSYIIEKRAVYVNITSFEVDVVSSNDCSLSEVDIDTTMRPVVKVMKSVASRLFVGYL